MSLPHRFYRVRRCVLASSLVALTAFGGVTRAQINLPNLGEPAAASLSGQSERELGEQTMLRLKASGGYFDDPEITAYLNSLGRRLVAAGPSADQAFEFFAVNSREINAFALPGGYVGVFTGLILLAETESELASVLAHEITHVTQRHIARQMAAQSGTALTTMAALAAAIVAAAAGNGQIASAAMASAMAGQLQSQINYTRESEREADRIGFQLLDRAGFDPAAMASFFRRLKQVSYSDESPIHGYLMTHPLTQERIAEAEDLAHRHSRRAVADSLDFALVRALLRSYRGTAEETANRARVELEQASERDRAAARYGLAAALLRKRDYAAARELIATLDRERVRHPMIEALAGQILQQAGELSSASQRYRAALADYPDHLQLVYDYPKTLLLDKQHAVAAEFVEARLARHGRTDITLRQIAAEAYAALGERTRSHMHQGEYYAAQGEYRAAMEQFQIAINADDAGERQRQVAEHRLKEVTEQHRKAVLERPDRDGR
ncbi:MAG: M48 family metalloprotease [Thiotrichales bacterium]